ncbi:MAG: IS1634 family transposase, partial [Candidatus Aminicenantes bacterium]|nr:IS1634 family transposase [Candidatus Aminicenantes bacterium]
MASIIKKIKKGKAYYYAVASARVDGKPRIVWQKYLGTIEAIIERAENAKPAKPKETVIFEAGGVAALLGIAQRLGLMELINEQVPKRDQGPSVGHYMVLAALNRALDPCSKLAIGDWYEQTVLQRLWRFPKSAFSSPRFWDHMDMISETAIAAVQDRLAQRIEQEFGLEAQTLLYDTTNFFTFISTVNDRNHLAQRGHSKAKRHDLRQVGLALLVTANDQIPLFHRVYAGNRVDVSLFPSLVKELLARHQNILGRRAESTLVFDKGNVSDEAMERIVVSNQHFVAALSANRAEHLLSIPLSEFAPMPGLPGARAYSTEEIIWGKKLSAVVVYTESFFTQQLNGVTHHLVQCQKKLLDLEKSLIKWRKGKARGKKPTVRGVKAGVNGILCAQFMKDLFKYTVEEEKGLPVLQYSLNHAALERLSNERLGRTVLVSDRREWKPQEVISAYRSLAGVEESFKNMKNIDFLHWQPAYHWTDQKLMVHGFYCVLALTLASLAHKMAIQAGMDLSLHELLKDLTSIREVAVIYPQGVLAHP